jgi:hypothetical protein
VADVPSGPSLDSNPHYANLKKYIYSDWLRAGWPGGGSLSPGRVKNVHFPISSRPALGSTQTPIKCVPGVLQGVKRQVREADHSPPTSTEVKRMRIYTSTPPYDFMA